MRKIKQLILHCSGRDGGSVDTIRRTHLKRGWSDIGYHYVIHKNGDIHRGRPERKAGAGVHGLNTNSIHICRIGRGTTPLTCEQLSSLVFLFKMLGLAYPESEVLGHYECNDLLPKSKHTRKTCPGKAVDMLWFRMLVNR